MELTNVHPAVTECQQRHERRLHSIGNRARERSVSGAGAGGRRNGNGAVSGKICRSKSAAP